MTQPPNRCNKFWTAPENQKIVWCEFNDTTKTIFYDQRIAISQEREEPVVWTCSKVEDKNVNGIARYTFKQDKWNDHTDYIEHDEDGNLVGIWCNWFDDSLTPIDPSPAPSNIYSKITYSGTKPEIKIGGSFKKFIVTFYKDDEPIAYQYGNWKFTIDNKDASDLLEISTSGLEENQIKVKFHGNDSYTGKVLTVIYESSSGVKSSVEMNLIGI